MIAPAITILAGFAAFAVVLKILGTPDVVRRSVSPLLMGLSALGDKDKADDEKEKAVRKHGLILLWMIVLITIHIVFGLCAVFLLVLLANVTTFSSYSATSSMLLNVEFWIGSSTVVMLMVIARQVFRKGDADHPSKSPFDYGAADKIIHIIIFKSAKINRLLRACDDLLFKFCAGKTPRPPAIFVTSLARGGTTALLNAMHSLSAVATHEYGDMPLISAPLLWSKIAGNRQRKVARIERAHNDGLSIDLGSPEAFEEVLWHLFWPEKYQKDKISLWKEVDFDSKIKRIFTCHFDKICYLRNRENAGDQGKRYLSKNNANIGRLGLLPKIFPGCRIVIPLRDPSAHAASLFRQHLHFSAIQQEHSFVSQYMKDIGHFEFGKLHRPICFDGVGDYKGSPSDPDYWLVYWLSAFKEIKAHQKQCIFVTQHSLRASPQKTMIKLCADLGIDHGDEDFSQFFRKTPDETHDTLFSPELLTKARQLYDGLASHSLK